MKLKVMGMIAGLAWGGVALAQGTQDSTMPQEPPMQEPSMPQDPSGSQPPSSGSEMSGGMGGSQMQGQGQQELSGSIVAVKRDKLYIKDENGAVVPVGVTHATQIDGKTIEKHRDIHSHLRREIKEGDQVRTRFNVEKTTENMASSVEKMNK